MSDEKPKPFAEVVDCENAIGEPARTVAVCGHELRTRVTAGFEASEGYLQRIADEITAAVEQREAKLRGALERLLAAPDVCHGGLECDPSDMGCAWNEARAVLAGAGPDYVPRAELDAANAKLAEEQERTRGAWMVLFDQLAKQSDITPDALALVAGSLGIKLMWSEDVWTNAWQARSVPDSRLIEALTARGYVVAKDGKIHSAAGADGRFSEAS